MGRSHSSLEHPADIEAYLTDQECRFEEFKSNNPLTPDMIERFERGRRDLLEGKS